MLECGSSDYNDKDDKWVINVGWLFCHNKHKHSKDCFMFYCLTQSITDIIISQKWFDSKAADNFLTKLLNIADIGVQDGVPFSKGTLYIC